MMVPTLASVSFESHAHERRGRRTIVDEHQTGPAAAHHDQEQRPHVGRRPEDAAVDVELLFLDAVRRGQLRPRLLVHGRRQVFEMDPPVPGRRRLDLDLGHASVPGPRLVRPDGALDVRRYDLDAPHAEEDAGGGAEAEEEQERRRVLAEQEVRQHGPEERAQAEPGEHGGDGRRPMRRAKAFGHPVGGAREGRGGAGAGGEHAEGEQAERA